MEKFLVDLSTWDLALFPFLFFLVAMFFGSIYFYAKEALDCRFSSPPKDETVIQGLHLLHWFGIAGIGLLGAIALMALVIVGAGIIF